MTDEASAQGDKSLELRNLAAIEEDLSAADLRLSAVRRAIAAARDEETDAIAAINNLQDELSARVQDMHKMAAAGTGWNIISNTAPIQPNG